MLSRGRAAGPTSTAPVFANTEPWHGHSKRLFCTLVSQPSWVQTIENAWKLEVPVRITARPPPTSTSVPTFWSPGKSPTVTVPPRCTLASLGPICPSPHPCATTKAAAAMVDLARNSRRFTQCWQDMSEDSEGDECRGPLRLIFILLIQSVEIRDDSVAFAPDREPVQPARRTSRVLHILTVGEIARVVLGALEPGRLVRPA